MPIKSSFLLGWGGAGGVLFGSPPLPKMGWVLGLIWGGKNFNMGQLGSF